MDEGRVVRDGVENRTPYRCHHNGLEGDDDEEGRKQQRRNTKQRGMRDKGTEGGTYPIFPGQGPLAGPVHVRLGERPLGCIRILIIDLVLEGVAGKGKKGEGEGKEEGTENGGERPHDDDDASGDGEK